MNKDKNIFENVESKDFKVIVKEVRINPLHLLELGLVDEKDLHEMSNGVDFKLGNIKFVIDHSVNEMKIIRLKTSFLEKKIESIPKETIEKKKTQKNKKAVK